MIDFEKSKHERITETPTVFRLITENECAADKSIKCVSIPSIWSNNITSNCTNEEFYDFDGSEQCLDCPDGGFCGGGVNENRVVAKNGYARLFHNTSIPAFVSCSKDKVFTTPNLCNGINLDNDTQKCVDHSTKSIVELSNDGCTGDELRDLERCNEGYGGFLCSQCVSSPHRYFRKAQTKCTKCKQGTELAFLAIGGIFAVLAGLGVLIWRKLASSDTGNSAEDVILLKVASNHSQFLSMVASFPLAFPDWLQSIFDSMKVASATNPEDVGLECYLNQGYSSMLYPLNVSTYYLMVFGILISPIIIAVGFLFYWTIHLFICRVIRKKKNKLSFSKHLRTNLSVSLVVTFFLLLPLLTKNTLGLFSCTPVKVSVANGVTYNRDWLTGENNNAGYKDAGNAWEILTGKAGTTVYQTNRLIGDPNVRCFDTNHKYVLFAMGLPSIILFIIGIPLFGAFFTWRLRQQDLRWKARKKQARKEKRKRARAKKKEKKNRLGQNDIDNKEEEKLEHKEDEEIEDLNDKQKENTWLHPFEFLRDGYKSHKWGWETVTMLRKILMNVIWILTVAFNQKNLGLMLGLLLVLCSLGLQQIFQPYAALTVNALDRSGLLVIAITFFLGLLIDGPERTTMQCPSGYTEDESICKGLNTTIKTHVCYQLDTSNNTDIIYQPCVEQEGVGLQWGTNMKMMNLLLSASICFLNAAWMVIFAIIFVRMKFGKQCCLVLNKCSHALSVGEKENDEPLIKLLKDGGPAPKVWVQIKDGNNHYLVASDTGEIRQLDQVNPVNQTDTNDGIVDGGKTGVNVGKPLDDSRKRKMRRASVVSDTSKLQNLQNLFQTNGDSSDSSYYSSDNSDSEDSDQFEMMLDKGERQISFELVWDQTSGTEASSNGSGKKKRGKGRGGKKINRRATNFLRQATRRGSVSTSSGSVKTGEIELMSNPMHRKLFSTSSRSSTAQKDMNMPAIAVVQEENEKNNDEKKKEESKADSDLPAIAIQEAFSSSDADDSDDSETNDFVL